MMPLSRSLAGAAAGAALCAAPLGAQQPDTVRIPAVVVTATRVPVAAAAVPATVEVITGDELRLRGATSLAAALQTLPGMTLAQAGSFGAATSLFLRGGDTKYVKVLVDGVPINDPGGAIDFGRLTTDNVDRIEVVRGPASVLYGADAVSGVVQIFTRRGQGAPRTIVSARGGTYGSSDEDVTMLGGLRAGDYSLALARHDTRGIYAFNDGYHNTVASAGFRFPVDSSTRLRVSLRYGDDVLHYPTDGGGTPVDTNAHNTEDRTVLAVDLTHRFTARLDAQLSVTSDATSGGTDDAPDSPTAGGYESVDRTRRRGAELRTNVALPRTTLTIGAQAEQEDEHAESQVVFGDFQSTSIFHASRRNSALYAQALSTLPASIVLTAGGRRDDNERFGVFGTYRMGASWQVHGGTQLRALVGTAFREPTFSENYATGFVTGNHDLRPERSTMWEAGLRQSWWNDRVAVGVTHFDQRYRDLIDYTGSTDACGASYCNVARARSRGRELTARVAPVASLVVDANLTHLETRVLAPGFDTTSNGLYLPNQQLVRRPTTSWNAGAAWGSDARGRLDVRVIHVGDRPDRDFRAFPAVAVVQPAYTRTDLGGALPLAALARQLAGAELTLHVENLFDVRYESVFNFLSPRRTVLAGARVSF